MGLEVIVVAGFGMAVAGAGVEQEAGPVSDLYDQGPGPATLLLKVIV